MPTQAQTQCRHRLAVHAQDVNLFSGPEEVPLGVYTWGEAAMFNVSVCAEPVLDIHAKNKIAGRIILFLYQVSRMKVPGYAPAPCHIAGIFRSTTGI